MAQIHYFNGERLVVPGLYNDPKLQREWEERNKRMAPDIETRAWQALGDENVVLAEPIAKEAAASKTVAGVAMQVSSTDLIKLGVVIDSGVIAKGGQIAVRAKEVHAPWAKEVFEYDGVKFIRVPTSAVIMARYPYGPDKDRPFEEQVLELPPSYTGEPRDEE